MPTIPVTRSSFAEWNRISFAGLLGAIVVLWLVVEAFVLTGELVGLARISLVSTVVERLVLVAVGTLAYVRTRPTASVLELGVVSVWGFFSHEIAIVLFTSALSLFGTPLFVLVEFSISDVLVFGTAQSRLVALILFFGMAAVFAGLYTAAGARRDRPLISALVLLTLPVWILVVRVLV